MENPQNKRNFRYELKYLISAAQLAVLKQRVSGLMTLDPHVAGAGTYNIRSLYFDDLQNRCLYEVENGDNHKSKYRIRIYNASDKPIHLEKKRKQNGMCAKTVCSLTRAQAECLMTGRPIPELAAQPKLLQELCGEILTYGMHPVIIVDYERIPFVMREGNVRVTFDTMLASAPPNQDFFRASIPKRPVLPAGMQLMEVKFDDFLPDLVYRCLQLDDLRQTAFSKYYLCRKYAL